MTPHDDARVHLAKAREFLEAAEVNRDVQLYNACASDAVISGINAKDAICLTLTGRSNKSDNHTEAVDDLRRSGRVGAALASTLSRLLKLKTKSQYSPISITASDASKAVEWARRMLASAEDVVAAR